MLLQVVQLVGAGVVLLAFVANQRFGLASDSVRFVAGNAIGTAVLAVVAGINRDWGFLLLEGVWAAVSTASLIGIVRSSRQQGHVPG